MQVSELESKGLKKNYKIVVNAAQIEEQTEAELKRAGERVKIPGFRPGFIPMKVLRQRYGKSVQGDVLKQAINRATNELLSEKKVRPAATPQVNIENYEDGGDLTFTMSFESFPEVPTVDFDKISLSRNVVKIEEKDVDEALARVAEHSPVFSRAKDGAKAELGQVTVIDFKGMIGDEAFEGGSAEDFRLELGSGQFIEGFEEQLVGAREGEDRMVKVKFPDQYAKQLAGKDAVFHVKVKEIQTKSPGIIDDEFAKARGVADAAALREAIRTQLVREYDQVIRRQLKKDLFDQLEESYDFELPQSMVDAEFKTIWERLQQAKAEGDTSSEGRSDDEMKEEYQSIARRRVKLGIMLADIGNRNKLQVSREEISRAVMQQASMFPGQEKQVMEFYRNHPERVEDMRGPILEEKAVDFVLSKVKFKDKDVTVADLVASEEEDEAEGEAKKKIRQAAREKESLGSSFTSKTPLPASEREWTGASFICPLAVRAILL